MRVKRRACIVRVLPLWTRNPPGKVISTVSNVRSGLSPFLLGPCKLYGDYQSANMENGWQFSKVYKEHTLGGFPVEILPRYWRWAKVGWADKRAHRYPMGKGRRPLFSLWDGRRLDYIDARKAIYGPLYAEAVQKTEAWKELVITFRDERELTLLDYDAYDHRKIGRTLSDVLNDPTEKMGHAFVLAMLLTNDPALNQMELRE